MLDSKTFMSEIRCLCSRVGSFRYGSYSGPRVVQQDIFYTQHKHIDSGIIEYQPGKSPMRDLTSRSNPYEASCMEGVLVVGARTLSEHC